MLFQVELKKNKRIYAMKVVKKELVNDDEVCLLCYNSVELLLSKLQSRKCCLYKVVFRLSCVP